MSEPSQPSPTTDPAAQPAAVSGLLAANLGRLEAIVAELRASPDPARAGELWKAAHVALRKTRADAVRAGRAVAERKVDALAELVRQAREAGDAPARRPLPAVGPPATVGPVPVAPAPEMTPDGAAPPQPAPPQPAPPRPPGGAPAEITQDVLKHALHAFKKRMKLTRLDDESRLGPRAMTGGRKSAVVAIVPPNQYPRAVWDELVKQGKLKRAGSGFYELVE